MGRRALRRDPGVEERARQAHAALAYQIIRFHRMGRSRSEIGALLRVPYRVIEAAIQIAEGQRL